MTTVQLSGLFCLPRIIYAMAVDRLFFEMFAYVHPGRRYLCWASWCSGPSRLW